MFRSSKLRWNALPLEMKLVVHAYYETVSVVNKLIAGEKFNYYI